MDYHTTAQIAAPPEKVWSILTDAAGYKDWNPEILAIEGRMALGENIKARVRLGDGALRTVPLRITAFQAPTKMEWTGGLPLKLFIGRRTFTVTPTASGTEFHLHLEMTGPMSPLILKSVGNRQPEVDSFSAALKARAER